MIYKSNIKLKITYKQKMSNNLPNSSKMALNETEIVESDRSSKERDGLFQAKNISKLIR